MEFAPALPHGELRELFDDVFFVTGSVRMPAPVTLQFSRNMTVVRDGGSLTLINSMRLDDAGLKQLDALGRVEHVIRIAGFHGMDDPFYKDRYGAKVWTVAGQTYVKGFGDSKTPPKPYFDADEQVGAGDALPIADASLFVFETAKVPEGLVILEREGGIVVSGDCLQNWRTTNEFFSWAAKPMMRLMGFIKPHNIGPGWLKGAKPDVAEIRRILDLDFDHVLPAHGEEVVGGAKQAYRPAIERLG